MLSSFIYEFSMEIWKHLGNYCWTLCATMWSFMNICMNFSLPIQINATLSIQYVWMCNLSQKKKIIFLQTIMLNITLLLGFYYCIRVWFCTYYLWDFVLWAMGCSYTVVPRSMDLSFIILLQRENRAEVLAAYITVSYFDCFI